MLKINDSLFYSCFSHWPLFEIGFIAIAVYQLGLLIDRPEDYNNNMHCDYLYFYVYIFDYFYLNLYHDVVEY